MVTRLFVILSLFFLTENVLGQMNDVQLANEYFKANELEKAKEIYEKIIRNENLIPVVHKNYLSTLYALNENETAERYLKRIVKNNPDNLYYKIDYGFGLAKSNRNDDANKYFDKLVVDVANEEHKVRASAAYFLENRQFELAEKIYLEGRKNLRIKNAYAYELANIYIYSQNFSKVLDELINFSESNPSAIDMVKNALQGLVNKEEDFLKLEKILITNTQNKPQEIVYNELLLWLYIQQKQFYKAFVQARSLEKRFKGEGDKLLELGLIAFQNRSYEDASTIFQYVVDNYRQSLNYIISKNYLISSKEEIIKSTFPIDYSKINSLITDYNSLIKEAGVNVNTVKSVRNMALLYAFYYGKMDTAIIILEKAIKTPQLPLPNISEIKLDLGDIYLLREEPWEATLLYSQVEKAEKDKPLGYEAKLKNAKLSYYKGDFKLAQSHLDILKLATSREIANDAMDLSLLIQDNIGLDSTEEAMKAYAKVDLLLFQNKKKDALEKLKELEVNYKDHTLIDEIIFLKAKILQEIGEFDLALENFEVIAKNYGDDIYGDDALFLMAQIQEESKKNFPKALELYTSHLKNYPGSIYTAEVRKRLRKLRGDAVN